MQMTPSEFDALADAAGEGRGLLAIEISLETMTDGLVQQDAGPAGSEHDGHGAGRSRYCLEIHECLAHGLTHEAERPVAGKQLIEAEASAAAAIALLAPAMLFHDHRNVATNERPHIRGQCPVACRDQYDLVDADDACHHLLDARIDTARLGIEPAERTDRPG